jgi:hypothetical protein
MSKFYSKSTGGFYAAAFRADYEASRSWPDDAIEITSEAHLALMEAQSRGMVIQADENGLPIAVPPTPAPFAEVSLAYLNTVRELREEILNRISGIGFAALAKGDTATAQAVVVARQALLDITKSPAVLAATDADSLKLAVIATYRAIVVAAPAPVRSAFNAVSL